MSWIPCPVCGEPRSDTVTAPDGDHVFGCVHCYDPGWTRPHGTDDMYAGRTSAAQALWLSQHQEWPRKAST
jgi:hypothetical protein